MASFVKLCGKAQLPAEGEATEISLGNRVICLANSGGNISAMDNVCVHRGGPLGQGVVDAGKIICPWHGWQFDPQTGESTHNAAFKVAVFPIKVEGDDVLVEL